MNLYSIWKLVSLVISLIALGSIIVFSRKSRKESVKQKEKKVSDSFRNAAEVLKAFLTDNGCKVQDENEDKENGYVYLNFKYNGGNFTATASTKTQEIMIFYPGILSTKTELCSYASVLADKYTGNVKFIKAYTQFREKDNEVVIDLSYETIGATVETLAYAVSSMQDIANDMRQDWDKQAKNSLRELTLDSRREVYLLHAAEFISQERDMQNDVSPDAKFELGALISRLYGVEEITHLLSLEIYSNQGVRKVSDPKEIYTLDIIDLVYSREHNVPLETVCLKLDSDQYEYVINIENTSETQFTAFMRMSVMRNSKETNEDMTVTNFESTSHSVSFIIAYDKTTDLNHRNEYQYMLLDAQDKIKDGRESELSREQKILLNTTQPSNQLYRGSKLFFSERYYEAVWYLETEIDKYALKLTDWDEKAQSYFVELAYMTGFCYYQLHNFKMAVYYLYFTQADFQLRYGIMLVNALVEANDVRVFREIDSMLDSLNAVAEKEELSSDKQIFAEFLMRRRAIACINFADLDSAEKTLTKLLEYPTSKDFAQEQLALIKVQRNLQDKEKTE